MSNAAVGSGLATALPLLLVPLIMAAWKRWTPPAASSQFDSLDPSELKLRNAGLNRLFTILMFVGLMAPLPLVLWLWKGHPPNSPLFAGGVLALAFGLMVDLPVSAVAVLTLRDGPTRFREFWRFYELKYGIGVRGIAYVYIPIGALAPVGLVLLVMGT